MIVDGVYKTGDMAEAAVLSMHGMTPSFERNTDGGRQLAIFVFRFGQQDDEEFFEDLISEIKSSSCKVEPRRFTRELTHVRVLMYEFLGVDGRSRRLKVS